MASRRATRRWARLGLVFAIACAASGAAARPAKAPRVESLRWFNSKPLKPEDFDGKVRLVEFWTFDFINCIRTVPAMRALHERFAGPDAIVIGVHTPELERERDSQRVGEAIKRLDLRFPVAMDNDYALWNAFRNRFWPTLYVVDKRGVIRHVHVGELHKGSKDWEPLLDLVDSLRREPA